ncbi:universal stress protein [Chitinophaga sedimenti]|uniref:universal stress protein n=1 Tax=Chitinophaga sedimenti TaxID=2033606 RepID=UPI002002B036|nr:universal stress protein [Chitinophaga sedimenti]MCK7555490.1 universal stress protein [Chitinophaga sedimenti]
MKKIAAIFDGLKFSESTLQYAIDIAKEQASHLTGIFPDDFIYNSFNINKLISAGATAGKIAEMEQLDKQKRDEAAVAFGNAATNAGLPYSVHRDNSIAIQEVLHESIYADLMVINTTETFQLKEQAPPTDFIRSLLSEVQCPVLLVPAVHVPFNKIVLLYDGEPSSVFAIKMCCYLLPSLHQLPVQVISVNDPGAGLHLDDNKLMREFLTLHFPHATYKVLEGRVESTILEELKAQGPGALTVLGAYRRGMVSRWLRESMADFLMRELTTPLFIAHNK